MIQKEIEELTHMEKGDLRALLSELVNNQQKIKTNYTLYYDEKEDKSWMEHYYSTISDQHLKPFQLFHRYHDLITKTHQFKQPYYISKDQHLYTWVDLQPDGHLKGIYSGKKKNPQKLIEEDFVTIQKRFVLYQHLKKVKKFSNKQIENQVREISNQHKYNTEHVVPLSWFRAREPMKGDLHHLFVCEPHCNSLRSNYPYYEYEPESSQVKINNCGKYDLNRFEPLYGKGVVARATLYFLLRYPKKITARFRKKIDISLLFRWHEEYCVTDYEKHRNKAIFEIQGNRNPFIDFPDLMKGVAFPGLVR